MNYITTNNPSANQQSPLPIRCVIGTVNITLSEKQAITFILASHLYTASRQHTDADADNIMLLNKIQYVLKDIS